MCTHAGRLSLLMTVLATLVTACAAATPVPTEAEAAQAEQALSSFLDMLARGDYAGAAELYGGPLDSIQSWNPEIDAQDVGGLLGYGCASRLLQCLPVRSIVLAEQGSAGEMAFNVEFNLPDGTLFVRGPCCGSTSTDMPDQSMFSFRVRPTAGGGLVVLDLPPYVP